MLVEDSVLYLDCLVSLLNYNQSLIYLIQEEEEKRIS